MDGANAPMDLARALQVLGLQPGATASEARQAYLRLIRRHHPDLAAPEAVSGPSPSGSAPPPGPAGRVATADARHRDTAEVTAAYAVLRRALRRAPEGRVPVPPTTASTASAPPGPPAPSPPVVGDRPLERHDDADGVIVVQASPAKTYAALYEAAGRVGPLGYYDQELGLVELIVRFVGGPTCSVLLTVQRSAEHPAHTEILCAMESIEASPTPPIQPVIEALVDELGGAPAGPG